LQLRSPVSRSRPSSGNSRFTPFATCARQRALESQARHSRALWQREEELRLHKEKLDAALDNMLQGLAMFDAEQRLIVCNRRYAEMYGLTAEQVRPGTTVRQIFEYRLANGFYHVKDSESFVGSWTSNFGDASARIQELADGRIISVVRRQMPNGGRIVLTRRRPISFRCRTAASSASFGARWRTAAW